MRCVQSLSSPRPGLEWGGMYSRRLVAQRYARAFYTFPPVKQKSIRFISGSNGGHMSRMIDVWRSHGTKNFVTLADRRVRSRGIAPGLQQIERGGARTESRA